MTPTNVNAESARSRTWVRCSRLLSWLTSPVLVVFPALLLAVSYTSAWADEPVDFNRQIRSILSDHCYQCHGPDEDSREADLRLDQRDAAIADLGGYAAIVPGKPDDSEIINRITSEDPGVRMPPPSTMKQLTSEQAALITRWIEQGALYGQHWSLLPIESPEPPLVRNTQWVRNPIDQFILARLEKSDIEPSSPADAQTLIKRLYIDLTGLLPTPEEVQAHAALFQADEESAIHQLVDHLLASPSHAERWARHWLDQARYADSHGYTIDGDRVMWPYRDWVIEAVQQDMPFDQFTVEQIAGDLLPNPTKRQLVATGFHRNTLINQEGGTDNEQFRNEAVVDRVNTTGAVWLGLTVGCAQCHNHKFDPISQQEYYQLFAFFNHGRDQNNIGPTVEVAENEIFRVPDSEKMKALEAAKAEVVRQKKSQASRQAQWEQEQVARLDAATRADWKPLSVVAMESSEAELETLDDGSILAAKGAGNETYAIQYESDLASIAALRLRVLPHKSLPKGGPGLAANGNFILTRLEVWQDKKQIAVTRAAASHAQPGYPFAQAIDGKTDTGWAINVGKGTPAGKKMNAEHDAWLVFDKPVAIGDQPIRIVLRHERNDRFYNIGRWAVDASSTAPSLEADESLREALTVDPEKRTDAQQALISEAFAAADTDLKNAQSRVNAMRQALGLGPPARSMIMQELESPRETYLHIRGDFLRKDKETGLLQPGVPSVLPPLPGNQESAATRLDLARWLVHPENPLTARVTVNRVWMRYFGRGLVETEDDFGSQGSPPTHPQLLDWLARDFMDNGWSMKRLHKRIVTSATYRQASHYRSDLAKQDARNRLLARQNRLRYDAEIIRDVALCASGVLNRKIGGPSVRPPQPAGVYAFTQQNKKWVPDTGPERFRRAMYTRFYRSAPYPMLRTFDSPDFQSACTRRPRSNTPLQSLTLANDQVFVELAQHLASRLMTEIGKTDDAHNRQRIERAFQICFCRAATEREIQAVAEFYQLQTGQFAEDPQAAEAVAPDPIPSGFDRPQAAAWTAVARALMNTDEFITRE